MDNKKRWAGVLRVIAVMLAVGAVVTLIPHSAASKPNMIGYKSLCTFAPVSTVIMLFAANFIWGIRKKKFLS